MSRLTDEQREQDVRAALGINPTHSVWPEDVQALLRLLDAERARADAAEAKVARVEWCPFVSPSSDDGYCACIKAKHPATESHACQHGVLA